MFARGARAGARARREEEASLEVGHKAAWILIACACAGCARRVDMSSVRGPGQAALTIPYTGVREESRLYPDYGTISASILTEEASPKGGKKGKGP